MVENRSRRSLIVDRGNTRPAWKARGRRRGPVAAGHGQTGVLVVLDGHEAARKRRDGHSWSTTGGRPFWPRVVATPTPTARRSPAGPPPLQSGMCVVWHRRAPADAWRVDTCCYLAGLAERRGRNQTLRGTTENGAEFSTFMQNRAADTAFSLMAAPDITLLTVQDGRKCRREGCAPDSADPSAAKARHRWRRGSWRCCI